MSTEGVRKAFHKELCPEKKKNHFERKGKKPVTSNRAIFNIKSSWAETFLPTFMEVFLSLCIRECMCVGCTNRLWGAGPKAEMYKTELDQTSSCCPVHPTASPSLTQPVLTYFYWQLSWNESWANVLLLITAYMSSQFCSFHLAMNLQWT